MDEVTRWAVAARDGDAEALVRFVRRTQPEVWRLCRALGDREDADDLTQQTYERALGALARFRNDASARTWLLSIARRTCADHVRRSVRRRRLEARVASAGGGGRGAVPDHVAVQAVADLVDRLGPRRREAFVLTQMLGLSYAEAADVCETPVGTIRSRVARARAELIEALDDAAADRPRSAEG